MTEQLTNELSGGADYATVARRVALLRKLIEVVKAKKGIWYWDPDESEWIPAVLIGEMAGNGGRVFRIDLFDDSPARLAFEWQVVPYSLSKPAPPDSAKVALLHTGIHTQCVKRPD